MARLDYDPNASAAAMASNWWRVILVDALLGVGVAAAGVALVFTWSPFAGAVLAAIGVLYVFAVLRRRQGFKDRRREAGLDDAG